MLEEILTYIDSPELPDEPHVNLESFHFENEDGVLNVAIQNYCGTEDWSRWALKAHRLRDYRIVKPYGGMFLCKGDHVLVWRHKDKTQQLYFRGVPESATEIVGRLLVAHREATNNWIPFELFFNPCCKLEELLAGGSGLLAEGPVFLMETYAAVLSKAGLKPNALEASPSKWWVDGQWMENIEPLAALVIGDSYFVAENFEECLLPVGEAERGGTHGTS